MRGGLLVNRATVLVLHLCRLEHFLPFVFLVCRRVIAWLAIDFRLVVIGIEVTRIWAVAHIHGKFAREKQRMAYFDTTSAENSEDQDVRETAENHPARLSGAFHRVKDKLGLRKIAD